MRPLEFHRLGLRLAQDADTEAQQRIAVTCLYYGLHHEAPLSPDNCNCPQTYSTT